MRRQLLKLLPTLISGEARSVALVARFSAGRTLAVRCCSLPCMLLPAFVAAPRNRTEREALAERYYPGAFCDKAQGSGDGCRLWHLNVFAFSIAWRPELNKLL